jgi:glycine/D-amino acid oxidase-like deaminating enzyme
MRTAEVVIVGGGVIGCAIAYHLSSLGLRPLLIERKSLAAEASGANQGMVGVSSGIPGRTLSHIRKSAELLARDAEAFGHSIELVRNGRLTLAYTPSEWAHLQDFVASRKREGIDVRLLTGSEARALEPALGPAIVGAAYVPGDGHVNPFLLTHAYAAGAKRRGAEILQGEEVTRLEVSNSRVVGVLTGKERIAAPSVILAAGAWSGSLLAPLGTTLPIYPGRGQMLVTGALPPITKRGLLRAPGIAIRQDARGHVLIGSTVEKVNYNRSVEPHTLAWFSRVAIEMVPALKHAWIVRSWAGLRPMTPDGLPIVDTVPGVAGLIVSAGHSRGGVTSAPVTGWLVGQMITQGTTDLPLDPFRLGRFARTTSASSISLGQE